MDQVTDHRRRILISPEYAVGVPLWNRSHGLGNGTNPEEVNISAELLDRLRAWNLAWEEANPPERPSRWSSLDASRWQQLGYRLARQLQAELPDTEILIHADHGDEVPVNERW